MSNTFVIGRKSPESKLLDMLIALSPMIIWSVLIFGSCALFIELTSVLTASAVHVAASLIRKFALGSNRPIFDLSPVVTGLLLSFTLPCTTPVYIAALGSAFAIIVKEAFGGMGRNPVNPALTGRVLLEIAFGKYIAVVPVFNSQIEKSAISSLLSNELPDMDVSDMFRGLMDGGVGEVSAVLILLGGLYLIIKKAVRIETPLAFLLAAAGIAMLLAPENVSYFRFVGSEILGGGVMLTAFFFMSDPVTTPHVVTGRILIGATAGALSILCRIYLGYEGIYIIALVLGLWTPLVDRLMRPKVFGGMTAPGKTGTAQVKQCEK